MSCVEKLDNLLSKLSNISDVKAPNNDDNNYDKKLSSNEKNNNKEPEKPKPSNQSNSSNEKKNKKKDYPIWGDQETYDQKAERENNFKKNTSNFIIPSNVNNSIVPFKGLMNMGNTCYMNSFLQSLFLTNEFKKKLLSENPDKCPPIIKEFIYLFKNMVTKNGGVANPKDFKNKLPDYYKNSEGQEDVYLFGTNLLDFIESCYKEKKYQDLVILFLLMNFSIVLILESYYRHVVLWNF